MNRRRCRTPLEHRLNLTGLDGEWEIGSPPQAVNHVIFYSFAIDRKHGPLHAHEISTPKFRFAAVAALLPLFVERL